MKDLIRIGRLRALLCFSLSVLMAFFCASDAWARDLEQAEIEEGYRSGWDHIEISISSQHVIHYVKGEIHCESDCVTGTRGSKDTPVGLFHITEKLPGTYLQPRGGSKVWVDRWMRLTSDGVGLHDATWRSAFGGDIYTRSGSHGCINLPKDFAFALYNEVPRGYPVLIEP